MSGTTTQARSLTSRLPVRLCGDQDLARRIAGGDRSAYDEMFRRYHQPIYGYCSAMVGPEEAKDVLQNVMTKAMTSMPDHSDFKMKPWLYRVARNECVDSLRASRRSQPGFEPDQMPDDSGRLDPHGETEKRERLRQLVADLNELPEKQRSTLVMRELSGLGYPEIARSVGTSDAGAKQLVYEARLALEQAQLGRELDCAGVRESISSMDRRRLRGRKVRSHLKSCPGCSDFEKAINSRRVGFQSLAPVLPVCAAAAILDAATKSGGTALAAGSGAGMAAGTVGGAGVATGVIAKGLAVVVVAGGIGVGTAEVVKHRGNQDQNATSGSREVRALTPAGEVTVPASIGLPVSDPDGPLGADRVGRKKEERDPGARGQKQREIAQTNGGGSTTAGSGTADTERLTPGQGNGQGPASLPEQSSGGQARADAASGSKPGQTGSPPPSRKPDSPPGQTGTRPSAPVVEVPSGPASPGQSGSAPGQNKTPPAKKSGE